MADYEISENMTELKNLIELKDNKIVLKLSNIKRIKTVTNNLKNFGIKNKLIFEILFQWLMMK